MIQNFQFSFLDFLTKYANIARSATAQPGIIRRIAIIAAIISMTGVEASSVGSLSDSSTISSSPEGSVCSGQPSHSEVPKQWFRRSRRVGVLAPNLILSICSLDKPLREDTLS